MILVTGATGGAGRHVVSQLLDKGADLRALTRDPATADLPTGVEVVRDDLAEPGGLDGATRSSEQVHVIGEAIGRPVRWEEQSREDARPGPAEIFSDESFGEGAPDTWAGFVNEPERVTSTVEEITGVPARTFRQWALDHAEDFR